MAGAAEWTSERPSPMVAGLTAAFARRPQPIAAARETSAVKLLRTMKVFRQDTALTAIPAAAGAVGTVAAWEAGAYGAPAAVAIAVTVFVLRLLAMHFNWRAPVARQRGQARTKR